MPSSTQLDVLLLLTEDMHSPMVRLLSPNLINHKQDYLPFLIFSPLEVFCSLVEALMRHLSRTYRRLL